jgi:hypothetical protein
MTVKTEYESIHRVLCPWSNWLALGRPLAMAIWACRTICPQTCMDLITPSYDRPSKKVPCLHRKKYRFAK